MPRSVTQTARAILKVIPFQPEIAFVLGSGFAGLSDSVSVEAELPYRRLPGFSPSRVSGHSGKLVAGRWAGVPALLLCGRSHYYEGHSMAAVTFPIRVLAACGVRALLLTNAAGGINPEYQPGDFMCLSDHVNWMGVNPLRGGAVSGAVPFVDLSETYDRQLIKLWEGAARAAQVRMHCGVYAAVSGPCYETPAEIRALALLGADAVGMSTVPEAIVAKHCGLRVAAVSCITNLAAGRTPNPICHQEVLDTGGRAQEQARKLIGAFVQQFALLGGRPAA